MLENVVDASVVWLSLERDWHRWQTGDEIAVGRAQSLLTGNGAGVAIGAVWQECLDVVGGHLELWHLRMWVGVVYMYTVQEKDDGMRGGGVGWEWGWECVFEVVFAPAIKVPKMWMEATVPSSSCEERT